MLGAWLEFEMNDIATLFQDLVFDFLVIEVFESKVWIQEKLFQFDKYDLTPFLLQIRDQPGFYIQVGDKCGNTEKH